MVRALDFRTDGRWPGTGRWLRLQHRHGTGRHLTQRRDEPVAAARHGLYVTRVFRGVAQGLPQLVDRDIEPVVEIDKRIGGPEPLAQLAEGHECTGALQQLKQDLKWLFLQGNPARSPAE